jgi:hypothetical protein
MVGIGRGDEQHIGVGQTRDEDAGIAGRYNHHLMSHAGARQYVGEIRGREHLRELPRFDGKPLGGAVRGKDHKQNVSLGVYLGGCPLQ